MAADENRKGPAVLGVEMCLQTGTTVSSDIDRLHFPRALKENLGEIIDGCGVGRQIGYMDVLRE